MFLLPHYSAWLVYDAIKAAVKPTTDVWFDAVKMGTGSDISRCVDEAFASDLVVMVVNDHTFEPRGKNDWMQKEAIAALHSGATVSK